VQVTHRVFRGIRPVVIKPARNQRGIRPVSMAIRNVPAGVFLAELTGQPEQLAGRLKLHLAESVGGHFILRSVQVYGPTITGNASPVNTYFQDTPFYLRNAYVPG